jgi:acetylornithine deacetylase
VTIETQGAAAHSSLSELGSASAVEPLLDALAAIRGLYFPVHPEFGATTANIGVIEAGTAPNVVAERGRAEVLFRTGISVDAVLSDVRDAAGGAARVTVAYRSEPVRFRVPARAVREAPIVSFACDLPLLPAWGEPMLVGPGSIREAHAAGESVSMRDVETAVEIYRTLALSLLTAGEAHLAPQDAAAAGAAARFTFGSLDSP